MKILMLHNRYQRAGGEDESTAQEARLLSEHGHTVKIIEEDNTNIGSGSAVAAACESIWSVRSYRQVLNELAGGEYDIVHVQNFFARFSPSIFWAAHSKGVPTVHSVRNFRLVCANALLLRDCAVCEKCVGSVLPWWGVIHRCYRGSRGASLANALMVGAHRGLGTWADKIDVFISLTEFQRKKLVEAGFPESKIVVKPNFLAPVPSYRAVDKGYAFFAGRLSTEKGIRLLIESWGLLKKDIRLLVAGEGPEYQYVRSGCDLRVDYLGKLEGSSIINIMRGASFFVFPSLWYEGFPRVILEAFSVGTPVIASRLGSMSEIIEEGVTGLKFSSGDPVDLAEKVCWAASHPDKMHQMGLNARRVYEQKYSPGSNYRQLVAIYEAAISRRRGRRYA